MRRVLSFLDNPLTYTYTFKYTLMALYPEPRTRATSAAAPTSKNCDGSQASSPGSTIIKTPMLSEVRALWWKATRYGGQCGYQVVILMNDHYVLSPRERSSLVRRLHSTCLSQHSEPSHGSTIPVKEIALDVVAPPLRGRCWTMR